MKKQQVLYIDSNVGLQIVIPQYLKEEGYEVYSAESVEEGIEKINSLEPDIILLEHTLPDGEGLTLIPQIRLMSNAGIIVVSERSNTTEKIVCLEMGADDYLCKPLDMRELSARIKAVLRRHITKSAPLNGNDAIKKEQVEFANGWVLDRGQYQLFDENSLSKDLTTGEFKLLEALVLEAGKAITRERLFEITRDDEYDGYDRAIDIQVARLRKKIGDDTKDPHILKTIRGVGYMYVSQAA